MQFNASLTGDAAVLAREHGEMLARLPATVHAFILVELQKWPTLFGAEQRYQRALLAHLSGLARRELDQAASGIGRIEADAAINRLGERNPARFQDESQALLRKRGLNVTWREAIDRFFQNIDPVLEAHLYPDDAPRRLIVQLYASGIAVRRAKLWGRFARRGVRVPLNLEGVSGTDAFLRALFGPRASDGRAPAIFAPTGTAPLDAWLIEAHEALHALCDGTDTETVPATLTGVSYDRLRAYRDDLTRTLNRKIQSGVESPQAFAAYARSLQIVPSAGTLPNAADVVLAFVRDVLLTGNGTLFMNNTFVEWTAIQALRRAQPRMLVTRYGVRDRLKPFSSMVLFSQPRASDRVPIAQDPDGSFIDVEQLSYYVWLNAEKNPAYRNKTLYLFLAEDVDEMLAIRSDLPVTKPPAAARLSDVYATMAHWLGAPLQDGLGRPIDALVGP